MCSVWFKNLSTNTPEEWVCPETSEWTSKSVVILINELNPSGFVFFFSPSNEPQRAQQQGPTIWNRTRRVQGTTLLPGRWMMSFGLSKRRIPKLSARTSNSSANTWVLCFLQLRRDVQQQSLKWLGRFPPRRRLMAERWCCCAVTSSWSTWDWSWARRSSSAITSRGWSRANSERWRRLLAFSLATRQDVFHCTRTESSVDPARPAALWWWWFFYFCSFQLVPQQPAGSFQKMHTRKLTLHCTPSSLLLIFFSNLTTIGPKHEPISSISPCPLLRNIWWTTDNEMACWRRNNMLQHV